MTAPAFPTDALREIADFHSKAAKQWSKGNGSRGLEIADMHMQRSAAALHAIEIHEKLAAFFSDAIGAVDDTLARIDGVKAIRDSIGQKGAA